MKKMNIVDFLNDKLDDKILPVTNKDCNNILNCKANVASPYLIYDNRRQTILSKLFKKLSADSPGICRDNSNVWSGTDLEFGGKKSVFLSLTWDNILLSKANLTKVL